MEIDVGVYVEEYHRHQQEQEQHLSQHWQQQQQQQQQQVRAWLGCLVTHNLVSIPYDVVDMTR